MAPKITRNLPYKLLVIFLLIVTFVACVSISVGHGIWTHQNWRMKNGYILGWEVSLSRIFADVVCDPKSDFYTTCHTIFQRTDGHLSSVTEMLCGLAKPGMTSEPTYQTDIEIMAKTCEDMTRLEDYSIATFALLCLACVFLILAFFSLLKWCYVSFNEKNLTWYAFTWIFTILDFILLCTTLVLYGVGLGDIGKFLYFPDKSTSTANDSLISPEGYSVRGWGFWMIVGVVIMHLLLFILYVNWIPRGVNLPDKPKVAMKPSKAPKMKKTKQPAKKPKQNAAKARDLEKQPLISSESEDDSVEEAKRDDEDKKVFWAFMPDVFQPALGGDDVFAQQNLYDDEVTITTHQEQVVTGYGTVTTTYMGEPQTVGTTYVEQPTTYQYVAGPGQQYVPQNCYAQTLY